MNLAETSRPSFATDDEPKRTPTETARAVLAAADKYGFQVQADRESLTVFAYFTPGDRDAYVRCDGTSSSVLGLVRQTRPGSTWGTDGASIGGHAGLTGGYYRLTKSGVEKRVLTAIRKLQG